MDKDLKNINVIVADRPYPLKVKPDEEQVVRDAAKMINAKIKDFRQAYAAKDKQDYLAMSALVFAVENAQNKVSNDSVTDEISQKITQLDLFLNEALT